MNGNEIYTMMVVKRAQLEDLIDPATFVLNPEAQKIQNAIYELQSQCPHEYVDGECKYCGKEEK